MKEDNEINNTDSPEESPGPLQPISPKDANPAPDDGVDTEDEAPSPKRKKPRVPKLYPGARKDLYPTCSLMWDSCGEELPNFTLFSPSYDEGLIREIKALIVTVRALPDEVDRAEPHITERGLAEVACLDYCTGWQLLKRYIIRAKFSSESAKLDLAGQKLHEAASDFDWSSVEALIVAADKFTTLYLTELIANRNMPPEFPGQLRALGVNFNTVLTRFRNFEKITEQLTDQKMEAENDLYSKTSEMGKDGQVIFKKTPAKARLFSFAAMSETVSGVGSASLVGTVTDEASDLPLGNAVVTILNKDANASSDDKGKYSIKRLSSGTYTVMVNAPGYLPYTLSGVVVEPATARRVNVKLQKA